MAIAQLAFDSTEISVSRGASNTNLESSVLRYALETICTSLGSVSIFVSRVVFKGAANHGCPSCIGG